MKAILKSAIRWVVLRTMPPVVAQVYAQNLTYLRLRKMRNIVGCLKELNSSGTDGDIYEFGIALGGSAIVMAKLMGARQFHGFDLFGMIPPPSERDSEDTHKRYEVISSGGSKGLNGDAYYGYEENLYAKVVGHFEHFGLAVDSQRVTLHQGLFEDTLNLPAEAKIALAHVDCDWFDPVKLCLERIAPNMVIGGHIVVDDYNDYDGCKRATDEFLESHKAQFRLKTTQAHAIIERIS